MAELIHGIKFPTLKKIKKKNRLIQLMEYWSEFFETSLSKTNGKVSCFPDQISDLSLEEFCFMTVLRNRDSALSCYLPQFQVQF